MTDFIRAFSYIQAMKGINTCCDGEKSLKEDLPVLALEKENRIKMQPVLFLAIVILGAIEIVFISKSGQVPKSEKSADSQVLYDRANYINYSDLNFASSQKLGKTLLFFAATTWCSNCRAIDEEIKKRNAELPKDLTILKVDYDRNQAMKTKYGVTMQTTLILFDKKGNEIKRFIGTDFDNLLSNIN